MNKRDYLTLALAVFILAIIAAVTPKVETIADEASVGAYGIDIFGLDQECAKPAGRRLSGALTCRAFVSSQEWRGGALRGTAACVFGSAGPISKRSIPSPRSGSSLCRRSSGSSTLSSTRCRRSGCRARLRAPRRAARRACWCRRSRSRRASRPQRRAPSTRIWASVTVENEKLSCMPRCRSATTVEAGLLVVRIDARLHVVEIGRDEADALCAGDLAGPR